MADVNKEKTAKVVSFEFKREWANPKGGSIYYHDVTLSNGEVVSIGKRKKNDIQVGVEVTYFIDDAGKFKLVQPQFTPKQGGGAYKAEPFEHKAAGFALSYAKDVVLSGVSQSDKDIEQSLFDLADKMYYWLLSKKVS